MKRLITFIFFGSIGHLSFGQMTPCEKISKEILADSNKSIWQYVGKPDIDFYCIGQYFAKKDLENHIYRIQSFGNSHENSCNDCNYEKYGFTVHYFDDVIYDDISNFIAGYNEISLQYLKLKIGDDAFNHINDKPKNYFNPIDFLEKNLSSPKNIKSVFEISVINDSVINVILLADSLFKDFPQFASKVKYKIHSEDFKSNNLNDYQVFNYQEIKDIGCQLKKKANNKYYLRINFVFEDLVSIVTYCECALTEENNYWYSIPFSLE